jgi:hypothetical protein
LQVSLLLIARSFVVLILDPGKCVFWLKHPIQMTIWNFNLMVVFQKIIMCCCELWSCTSSCSQFDMDHKGWQVIPLYR